MKLSKIFTALALMASFSATSAQLQVAGGSFDIALNNINLTAGLELQEQSVDVALEQGDFSTQASAQGIVAYRVATIVSSRGVEQVTPGASVSNSDHYGNIEVYVFQYGYGNDNGGTLNGARANSTNSASICGTGSNLHFCNPGETVTGWMYQYIFNNSQGGFFNSSAYSVAVPFGTKSASIQIR